MEIKNNKNKEFLDCVELTQTDNRAFLNIFGMSRELKAYTLHRSMTGGAVLECEFLKGGKTIIKTDNAYFHRQDSVIGA